MLQALRISLIIIIIITSFGCSGKLPKWEDPKYSSQPVDANKDGVFDEDDIRILEANAKDCFDTRVFPFFKKSGIEIKPGQKITKEMIKRLKKTLTVDEWEKLTDGMNEWIKINRQLEATKKRVNNPPILDSGRIGDFIATNECLMYFWFKDGRQSQLIGVGIPNNTSGYMLMSRDMFYKLALGKQARIEYDKVKSVKIAGTDQVLLVYLYVGKKFINAEMIAKGYARAKPTPQNNKYDDLFMKLEKEARENKRGIWALADDF